MKKVEREITTKELVGYEAIDGTMFPNEEECIKYEKSARGVLVGRIADFTVNKGLECDIFKMGVDNEVWVTMPRDEKDIDTIKQLYHLDGCWKKEHKEEYFKQIDLDNQVGKVVFVAFSEYDDEVWLDTMQAMMDRIMGTDKKSE